MIETSRIEPPLTPEFRKDSSEESFLRRLNNILGQYNDQEYDDLEELYPTLHIVGVARSGTTLLYELVAAHLDVGYIDNLIAAFWRAPLYGIRLSKKLISRREPWSFESRFGRTRAIHEPHEFGYFWSELLGYREPLERNGSAADLVDWNLVRRVLINMAHEFGKPLAFKSLYVGWHVAKLQEILPKSCFVRIRRDPAENAASLLNCRREFSGSVDNWVSLKPAAYSWLKDEPPYVQAVGQVYYLERAVTRQIEAIAHHNVMEVTYEKMCQDPRGVLAAVQDLLNRNGADVSLLGSPPEAFEVRSSLAGSGMEAQIRSATRSYYNH